MTMNFRRRYITDFGRIEGIPGVYMANQLSSKMFTDPSARRSLDFEKFIQTKVGPTLPQSKYVQNLSYSDLKVLSPVQCAQY